MRRFCLVVFLSLSALSWVSAGSLVSKKVYMLVDQDLKSGTGFFSSKVGSLKTGDVANVTEEKGNWVKIEAENKVLSGWVLASCVTTKKVPKTNSRTTADAGEIALAGRGWNSSVEKSFKGIRKNAFDAIDRIEAINLDVQVLLDFIRDGGLREGAE